MTDHLPSETVANLVESPDLAARPAADPAPEAQAVPVGARTASAAHTVPAASSGVVPQDAGPATDFVYAIGHVKVGFPSLDVEKEYQRAAKTMTPPADPNDFYAVLSAPSGRYLADYLCWVLEIGNVDTYILRPRSPPPWTI